MKFIHRLGKRIFNYTIDGYFVFRSRLDDRAFGKVTDLPEGYSVRVARSEEDTDYPGLCDLWQEAYCQDNDTGRGVVEGIVNDLFHDGDVCCCLIYKDTVVGMDWLGFSQAIKRMQFTAYLKNESATSVGHHIYITPSHRGKGLQRATDALRKKTASEKGAISQYLFVGVKNFASVRNMMKCNQHYKLIYHAKIDIPFLQTNLFPGRHIEQWVPCAADAQTRALDER